MSSSRRNPNIKKANTEVEITPEQVNEFIKCSKDPVYFIKKYIKIQHPKHGSIPFELYDYQEKMIREFQENRYNICLLSRQSGKSTTSAAYILWFSIFQFDKTVLITSYKGDLAKEIIERIQYAYEYLPMWLKPGIPEGGWNKHSMAFDNKSRIISTTTSETSGRGLSISLLFCDELAHVKPHVQEQFWTSIGPTLSCVVGNTKVLTSDGYREIEEFHIEKNIGDYFPIDNLAVWGKAGMELVSNGYVSPESSTLIIRTRHGLEVEVTQNHPLYALRDQIPNMIPAKELNVGDHLRVDIGMNVFGDKNIDEDIAYMLGGYIAEGWMCNYYRKKDKYHSIYINNTDEDFRNVFLNSKVKKFTPLNSSQAKIKCHSVELVKLFESYGIEPHLKCFNKKVPKEIFKCDKKTICMFLAGLFDGGGSVTDRSINLTSTSKQLIQEIQLLLNNIGIVSSIYFNCSIKKMEYERKINILLPQGKHLQSLRDSWGLNIPLSQYKKFKDLIGLKIKRKIKRLDELIDKPEQDDFKHFSIPANKIKTTIKYFIKRSEKTEEWWRDNDIRLDKCFNRAEDRKITLKWLSRFYSKLKEIIVLTAEEECFFNEYLNHHHYWDDIVSITESKNKTYDFTVPKTHSFLQNGIIGSNTGGSCIVASTPNGDTELFSTIWRSAEVNLALAGSDVQFAPIRVKWSDVPGRDEEFKRKEISKIGLQKWLQEYECAFLSSDALLIDSQTLTTYPDLSNTIVYEKFGFQFFADITPNETYIVGVDPATGSLRDFSVIEVFHFPSLEQVAEFRNNSMDSTVVYSKLKKLFKFLGQNKCEVFFSVENNGVGEGILSLFNNDETIDETIVLISEEGKNRPGFTTTKNKKMKACLEFKTLFESGKLKIKSQIVLKELKTLVKKSVNYEAQRGSTDDCISAILVIIRIVNEMTTYDQRAFEKFFSYEEKDISDGEYKNSDEDYDDGYEPDPIVV